MKNSQKVKKVHLSSGSQPGVHEKSHGILKIFIKLRFTLGFSMEMSQNAFLQLTSDLEGTRKEKGREPLLKKKLIEKQLMIISSLNFCLGCSTIQILIFRKFALNLASFRPIKVRN
jgi:hypothetical protein